MENYSMDYAQIKKLDEDSAKKMQEGTGPVDECICSLLAGTAERKSIGASIKKAFASIKPGTKRKSVDEPVVEDMPIVTGGKRGRRGPKFPKGRSGEKNAVGKAGLDIPLAFNKEQGGIYSTKEVVKKKGSCGRCGCDKENIVMKHSYANIRITSPDVSSICPCPTSCLPEKANLLNNIKVTIERVTIDPDSENSEASLHNQRQPELLKEPDMTDKKSLTSLINAQYGTDEDKLYD